MDSNNKLISNSISTANRSPSNHNKETIKLSSLCFGNESSAEPMQAGTKVKLSPSFKKIIDTSPVVKLKKISNSDKPMPGHRYPKRERRPPARIILFEQSSYHARTATSKDKQEKKDKIKSIQLEDLYDWSDCKVALEHDRKYNFFPEPGPSHINFYENVSLPGYYAPVSLDDTLLSVNFSKLNDGFNEFDSTFQSLYDATMFTQNLTSQTAKSPEPLFNISDPDDELVTSTSFQVSTPILRNIKENFLLTSTVKSANRSSCVIITPVTITPAQGPVLKDLINYDLPQVIAKGPFYSDFDDATHTKEVGHTILHIPTLAECEDFESSLVSTGLNAWRRNIYMNIASMDSKEKVQNKSLDDIREFFAVHKQIVTQPSRNAPTVKEAETWLRGKRQSNENDEKKLDADDDSPIKVRREKAKIILENGGDDDCDVSLSCSPISVLSQSKDLKKPIVNKLLTKVCQTSKRAKLSLNNTFDKLKNSATIRESPNMFSDCADSESPPLALDEPIYVPESEEEIPSSQEVCKNATLKNVKHMNGHTEKSTPDSSLLNDSVSSI